MTDIVTSSFTFINKHFLDIILVSLGLFIMLVYVVLNNIPLNPNLHEGTKKVKEVIVIEPFNTIQVKRMEKESMTTSEINDSTQSLCDKYQGQSHKIEELCSNMSNSKCSYMPCCVLASLNGKEQCVSGDKHGPTYHTDEKGNMFHLDYYYYQNKKYN